MSDLFGDNNGAIFSDCKKYRYVLWRTWDETKPKVMFIGLNPSKANADKNDNTITKVIKVAQNNGFGGLYMLNLFSIISEKPEILLSGVDCLSGNDEYLAKYAAMADKIVFCWGVFKQAKQRAETVKKMFTGAYCFKITKGGHPWHPLYCLDKTEFVPFKITT